MAAANVPLAFLGDEQFRSRFGSGGRFRKLKAKSRKGIMGRRGGAVGSETHTSLSLGLSVTVTLSRGVARESGTEHKLNLDLSPPLQRRIFARGETKTAEI